MRTVARKLRDVYCRLPQQYDLLVSMLIITGLLFALVLVWRPAPEHRPTAPPVNVPGPDSPAPGPRSGEPSPAFTDTLP